MSNLTVASMTSGNPLMAELVETSKLRAFFGLPSVKLKVYCQGLLSTRWRWSENWYHPREVTGL